MKVELVAYTVFHPPIDVPWKPDESNWEYNGASGYYSGSDLAEFAGRACYQSWNRPNPKTATNEGYIENIINVGHFSVLEHANATFYITGVSRSLTHELVRHRHFSYSQLSQRYVDESDTEFIPPPVIAGNDILEERFWENMREALDNYVALAESLTRNLPELKRKEIRQAARSVLPNATETKIVVTGNYRAWWEFLLLRATEHADVEIRALAIEILRQLQDVAPAVFNHFEICALGDTEVAKIFSQDLE